MRKAFLLVLCTVAALTVRPYAQTHTGGGASVSSTGLGNGATVLDVSTFPGATMDAKLQACINAIAPAGTCDARGITGTRGAASTLKVNKSVTILWGAVNYQTPSTGSGIYVTADNVSFIGLGVGKTIISSSTLYHRAIQVGPGPTFASPNKFSMSGISLIGPNPDYSGILDTSDTSVTWTSGPTNFANLIAGEYIGIGPLLTPYQIATVDSNTSLTLTTSAGNQTNVPYRVNPYSGNVSISGTSVTWLSGSNFAGLSRNLQGGINFGSPGSYTDQDGSGNLLKVQSVNSNTSLTLAVAPSCGEQTSIPYFISWDVNGTVGVDCLGCQNMQLSNNEFTGWSHGAIGLSEAAWNSQYAPAAHAVISGNNIHDNPGEGVTIYVHYTPVAQALGYNLVTNNQMNYNGLSCYDTNSRFNTFSHSRCNYTGWANKIGDYVGIQIHGSDNTVTDVTVDFANASAVAVTGSNQMLSNVHACEVTNMYFAGGTGGRYVGGWAGNGVSIGGARDQSSHITLKDSIICNNTGLGIIMSNVDQTLIEGNQIYSNGSVGINTYSKTTTNTSLIDNIVTGNREGQIFDSGLRTLQMRNRTTPGAGRDTDKR